MHDYMILKYFSYSEHKIIMKYFELENAAFKTLKVWKWVEADLVMEKLNKILIEIVVLMDESEYEICLKNNGLHIVVKILWI